MDLISDQYDPNDCVLRRTVELIKAALDPAGTLAAASRASGRPAALTAPTCAHREPFLDINSRSSSMLFTLVRGVTGSDAAAQKSVSGGTLIRGLWASIPTGPTTLTV